MAEKILLVDDDEDITEFLGYNLRKEGYEVFVCNNGKDAIRLAKTEHPDLIVLDVMMPGMDGVETCLELKEIPIVQDAVMVFLTARNEDYSQIAGLEAGADDYISKPIKPRVFAAKVKSLLKRKNTNSEDSSTDSKHNGIRLDRDKYLVEKDGEKLSFPKKEFELLALLISKPGNVFSREVILNTVWGDDVVVGDRTIDVHIRKLREKLGNEFIKTIKGVGYKFESE
ncbi:MAG: response regulator transcription factor [Flavobacteriales bacterium]|nr:response regulator transcription factor [Flavobacteriales bacterium]